MFVLRDLKWTPETGNTNGEGMGWMQEELFVVEKHFSSYSRVNHTCVRCRRGETAQGSRALAALWGSSRGREFRSRSQS